MVDGILYWFSCHSLSLSSRHQHYPTQRRTREFVLKLENAYTNMNEFSTGSTMSKSERVLKVYDRQRSQVVARVVLNGYDIRAGVITVPHGAMRSFKIVEGDLWNSWDQQTPLIIANDLGQEAPVRVAAIPSDEGSFGLIEFL
jgi:hypothetical protein